MLLSPLARPAGEGQGVREFRIENRGCFWTTAMMHKAIEAIDFRRNGKKLQ
jgi:hypothetical protein